jgi:hypothetical protein
MVQVIRHGVQLLGGKQPIPTPEAFRFKGDGVEEVAEPLEDVPVMGVGELSQEGLAPDDLAVEVRECWGWRVRRWRGRGLRERGIGVGRRGRGVGLILGHDVLL